MPSMKIVLSLLLQTFIMKITSGQRLSIKENTKKESIEDIFDEQSSFDPKLYYHEDFPAFNTSITFTLPLFHFTLPGLEDNTTDVGMDGKPFGVLAFIALYFIGVIGIIVYTVIQKWVPNNGNLIPRKIDETMDRRILDYIYDLTDGLPEALNMESCAKLSICEAYESPIKYGFLAWAIKTFIPIDVEEDENKLTEYEKAAVFGNKKIEECYYKYQCLLNPLEFFLYAKDYAKSIML